MKTLSEILTGRDELELQRHDRETEKHGIETAYLRKSIRHMDREPWRNLLFAIMGAGSTLAATYLLPNNHKVQSELELLQQEYKSTSDELDSLHIELQELKRQIHHKDETKSIEEKKQTAPNNS